MGLETAKYRVMVEIYEDLMALVGKTPLVDLKRIAAGVPARVVAKLEMLNPGGSIKDRIGGAMIEAAEKAGELKPGGVIVEPTSGNTGVGLAIAAAHKGYRCIFVMPDKMSQEKINLLRAYGAEVIVTPTDVAPESPRSYYSVANRLAEEIPNAFQPNQYHNFANPEAHYLTTGPEVWEQTEGAVAAFVAGVGTGGTISGVGKFLKEKNPEVLIVGADPEGSIYTQPEDIHPYLTEGIGEDFWPETFDRSIVDRWEKVSDQEAFHMTRRLAKEEGILAGGSSGSAMVAALRVASDLPPEAVVVVLFPDGGRSYLSKVYNDAWMAEHGFLRRPAADAVVRDVLRIKGAELPRLIHVHPQERIGSAIETMREYGVSQMPVIRDDDSQEVGSIIGSIRERDLLDVVLKDPNAFETKIVDVMRPPMRMVDVGEKVDSLVSALGGGDPAIIAIEEGKPVGVITRADLLTFFEVRSERR